MPLEKKYRELFNLVEVEDVLTLRLGTFQCKLKDLFLCIKLPNDSSWNEFDSVLETKFGPLKIFFVKDPDLKTNLLLHKEKFNYPTPGFLSSLRNIPTQKANYEADLVAQQMLQMEEEEKTGGKLN